MEFFNYKNKIYDSWFDWQKNGNLTISELKKVISDTDNFNSDILPFILREKIKSINVNSILDYGAGLGRNFNLLNQFSENIDYLDLKEYENNHKEYIKNFGYKNFHFIEMIPNCLINKKYDLIYASVVLQHIIDDEIYNSIIKILNNSCEYIVLIQNMHPIKSIFFDYFNIEFEDINNEFFKTPHRYCLFRKKII